MAGHWCTEGVLGLLVQMPLDWCSVVYVANSRRIGRKDAQRCLDTLRRRGFVERVGTGRYRLTKAGREAHAAGVKIRSGPTGPHTGNRRARPKTFQARFWKALRNARKGTIPDLVSLAVDDAPGTKAWDRHNDNARHYMAALIKAGFVTELARREPGTAPESNGFKVYLLVVDPGPATPAWNAKRRRLRDPNSGEVFDFSDPGTESGASPESAT